MHPPARKTVHRARSLRDWSGAAAGSAGALGSELVVECQACGRSHREGVAFCGACGARLAHTCAACGHANPVEHRYCESCGATLGSEAETAERRQLTILFADLAGYTRLSELVDPEDLHRVVQAYQAVCARAVAEFDGRIAQYLGDGVLAYFGLPTAHEDDARRAVKAALAIRAAVPALNEALRGSLPRGPDGRIAVRIAVHTGAVVVGDIGAGERRERSALGGAPNLAARLQQVAGADSIVVTKETRLLLGSGFDLEDLGEMSLKGVTEPVQAFRVLRERASAREPSLRAAPTPLVGRGEDLERLLACWAAALQGRGRAVLIEGEAGIGKSRLVAALRERLAADAAWVECRCSPYHTSSVFHPVIELIERSAGIAPEDSVEDRLAKLKQSLAGADPEGAAALPLFAALLSLPAEGDPSTSPEARRRRTLDALVGWLVRSARARPAVLVVEDVHWIDPSTRELVLAIVERAVDSPILTLLTQRTGVTDVPGSGIERHLLHPLRDEDARQIARNVAGAQELPAVVLEEVVRRTDGVPLFVEELTKAVIESGARGGASSVGSGSVEGGLPIPSTLQDSLMARLDRLGTAKQVAQLASVIGREFSWDVLVALSPSNEGGLRAAVTRLVEADLIRERESQRSYVFKHALVQETAYGSLLRGERRRVHAKLAQILEERFPEQVSAQPEVVARHWEGSSAGERAIELYRLAGDLAMRRSARPEAIEHYSRAISLLTRIDDPDLRARRELALLVALGAPLVATKGYGNPEVERSHRRARELCREVGEGPELHQALSGLFLFHQARAEIDEAARHAGELLAFGERASDPFVTAWGHFFSAVPDYYRGSYAAALDHLERALRLHDPSVPIAPGYVHEHDPRVSALCYAAMTAWTLGDELRARDWIAAAIRAARALASPFNLGFALSYSTIVHFVRGDAPNVRETAAEAVGICEEHELPVYLGVSLMLQGWATAKLGDGDRGIAQMRLGLAKAAATGTRIEAPRALGALADAQLAAGNAKAALDTATSALAIAEQKGTHFWDAELLRLRGESLLAQGPESEPQATECLQRALDVARSQHALGLELRVATASAEGLFARGDIAGAQDLLAPVLARFAVSVDSPDLDRGRDLLARLA
ncbi:MAG TPA: AAA family ATPase [Myxococcota bacterium]|nr:AAA family ATPase [Myxococcota bacterium]